MPSHHDSLIRCQINYPPPQFCFFALYCNNVLSMYYSILLLLPPRSILVPQISLSITFLFGRMALSLQRPTSPNPHTHLSTPAPSVSSPVFYPSSHGHHIPTSEEERAREKPPLPLLFDGNDSSSSSNSSSSSGSSCNREQYTRCAAWQRASCRWYWAVSVLWWMSHCKS